ncbi:MAG: ABC transporter ATP-binding protein [Treponema sp.]|nr:ABC transporter ATP-binding protein [Treponema sp.]
MIEIKNLTKKFKTSHSILEVFNDFSLTVKDGTFLGIQGKSGAGKSTLLTLLAGLQPADSGSIKIGESEITKLSQKKLAAFRNQNIGFVSQEQSFLENLNVLDNVRLPAYLAKKHLGQKVSDSEISQRAKQLLSDLGISHLVTQYPSDLSGGENHRLLIARALINNPKIILADEPTDSVDQERTQEILKIFRDLASQGKIVILVSHDQQALSLCDCVVNI